MPYFNSHGSRLYYQMAGNGPVIVFTHGAGWDHEQWEPQVKELSRDYTCIVWDVRGHGRSSLPDGKVEADQFVYDLQALLAEVGAEKVTLCGLSMGAHISLRFAAINPEKVRGLVLIGAVFSNSFTLFERVTVPVNRLSNRLMPIKLTAAITGRMLGKINKSTGEYAYRKISSIPKKNWVRLWDSITRMESEELLGSLACPVLILHGEFDSLVAGQQKHLAASIPGSCFFTIQGAHHGTNLDNPADVNKRIRHFLQQLRPD